MKARTSGLLSSLFALGSLCLGAGALAADANSATQYEKGPKATKMDADGDGQISRAEHAKHAEQMFLRADANKDGKLSEQEMQDVHSGKGYHKGDRKGEHMGDRMGDRADRMADQNGHMPAAMRGKKSGGPHAMSIAEKLKSMDKDGDGAVSAAEHAAGAEARFAQMDTDKDGNISKSEMKAGYAEMAAQSDE